MPHSHNSRTRREPSVSFRLATEDDLEETYRVMLRANEDLNQRLGRVAEIQEHSPRLCALAVRRNGLRYDSERFWVAEFDGAIGGFGLAIRRRSFWYLAALHVLPEHQARGVGHELAHRCLGDSAKLASSLLALSESVNLAANGLYAHLGLFPEAAVIHLVGTPVSLGCRGGIELREVLGDAEQPDLDRFDRLVLGEIRPEDHECWLGVSGLQLYLVLEGRRPAGYIYVNRAGALGPAAVQRPDLLCPAISAALEILGEYGAEMARMRIAGTARETLWALLKSGFKFDTGIGLFLSSSKFGLLDQYLFSGADALF